MCLGLSPRSFGNPRSRAADADPTPAATMMSKSAGSAAFRSPTPRQGTGIVPGAAATDLAGAVHGGLPEEDVGVTQPWKVVMAAKQPDFPREMGERGFEPLKAEPTGLQPVPFGRSGTPPGERAF